MLSLPKLKKYYIHMYEEIRNYIWDFNTVKHLADLEVAIFRRFPDSAEVRVKFNSFYSCISRVCSEDEYLAEAVSDLREAIFSDNEFYSLITQPREV